MHALACTSGGKITPAHEHPHSWAGDSIARSADASHVAAIVNAIVNNRSATAYRKWNYNAIVNAGD